MTDSKDPLGEQKDEEENKDWKEAGEKLGSAATAPLVLIGSLFAGFLVGMSRKIPGRSRIQKWMINTGIEGLWRTSDSHMIAMTIYGDGAIVPRPAVLETEEGRIKTNNDEEWTATDIQTCRMGDAPVVFGVADDHELASPVAARVSEAVDFRRDNVQTVKETAEGIEMTEYQTPQQAVADGGEGYREPFDDVWVDARNPLKNAAGWIVSMSKAYDVHWSTASAEEMKKQEDRGRLAEMDPSQYDNRALKFVLLFGAGLALGLFGPALAQRIAGEAAESGGSVVNFWLQPLLTGLGVV